MEAALRYYAISQIEKRKIGDEYVILLEFHAVILCFRVLFYVILFYSLLLTLLVHIFPGVCKSREHYFVDES